MAVAELLGASLKGSDGADVETASYVAEKSAIGLYFIAAEPAEPCAAATEKLKASLEALMGKGGAIVIVPVEAGAQASDLACPEIPFENEEQRTALMTKFEITAEVVPKLVFVDPEGELLTAEGVARIEEDAGCENFPWKDEEIPTLSEDDILVKLGIIVPEKDEDDLVGIFINKKKYVAMGLLDSNEVEEGKPFTGDRSQPRPYGEFDRDAALEEVRKQGFASDYHAKEAVIKKFPGPKCLIIFDPKRIHGDNYVMCTSQKSYDREWARINELRQTIIDDFEKSLLPSGGGEDGEGGEGGGDDLVTQDENIFVQDLPWTCGEWKSETMEKTHEDVSLFTMSNQRPLMQVMITRPRAHFGKTCKFSDSGENLHNCRPQKDPNYALQRKELEIGIQAVKDMRSSSCQTTWFRPVNKSTQYCPDHFLNDENNLGDDQVHALTDFLSAVSVSVEEALQTNETVDIFQEEFAHLGEDDSGATSKAHTNLREIRNFADVTYTKMKRIEWVEWVPNSTDMLACSCCENIPFNERLDGTGKATVSTILIWSFQDTLSPHAVLVSPWEVPVFKFYPSNERFLIGGLANGQMAVWKLSDADLGYSMRERTGGRGQGVDEDKGASGPGTTIPTVQCKQTSIIDESHRKAVVAIEFLPATLEIERRKGASEKNPKDGPIKYFVTIAGDGQVMIWDIQSLLESINDADFMWRPVHRVQLQRPDSATEMGCCQILYCHDRFDEKGNKQLTCFYASTEEGELIFGDWNARGEEDRKADICKKIFNVSKTFRPMLSLERSPFFPEVLLGVTDWAFYLWKDGVKDHLFQSSYTSTYFTRGVWSPTRPSVVFLGLVSGGVDIWDFSDQSHKASLTDTGASTAISSMVFLRNGDMHVNQMLAIGDGQGHVHVHTIPKNLVRQAGKEYENMRKFLDREESRVKYFEGRRQELSDLKDQMEKQAQMAADREAMDQGTTAADIEKQDYQAEQLYKQLEQECLELLQEYKK
eukprot:TRINITY_DN9310_c0_g1_i1.p1 TRINITY_DN9310_c0_g1~~TRINITY_DN9310_c0_g1_i1.p1  ORF type:complete len:989 (-),score=339.09 TRINITY_DN9310_c0_g1_i1:183-3149(-)